MQNPSSFSRRAATNARQNPLAILALTQPSASTEYLEKRSLFTTLQNFQERSPQTGRWFEFIKQMPKLGGVS